MTSYCTCGMTSGMKHEIKIRYRAEDTDCIVMVKKPIKKEQNKGKRKNGASIEKQKHKK